MRLDEREWKPFYIRDLFERFEPGKGKGLVHLTQVNESGIPYVGATNRNNGVLCFIHEDENSLKLKQPGNCIGFIKNGDGSAGYAIYKEAAFISTNDVIYAYKPLLNKYVGLFFVVAQDKIESKYSHGYKRDKKRLLSDRIMLPVNESGDPDYVFMEAYIRELMLRKLEQYRAYMNSRLAQLVKDGKFTGGDGLGNTWYFFTLTGAQGLFSVCASTTGIDKVRLHCGDDKTIPYVTRTESNNGISEFISNENKVFGWDNGNCVTIGLDTQTAFWQDYGFITGQNIHVLRGTINKYSALFLAEILRQQMKKKFNWGGNGATLGRLKNLKILLPVDSFGNPNYGYMDAYTRDLMKRKLIQYRTYLETLIFKLRRNKVQ